MDAGPDSGGELLAARVAGDPHAFGLLLARHRDRLWAVALRSAGNPDDTADAPQEACIAAFRRAGTFRGEAAVPPGCTGSWSTPAWTGSGAPGTRPPCR